MLEDKIRRRIKPMKSSAPKFTGLPKIYKQSISIGLLVNFTAALGLKIAKTINKIKVSFIYLQNNHSIKNQQYFTKVVQKIKMKSNSIFFEFQ